MPITATVTPNFVFKTGMELTAKMLNDVARPTVTINENDIRDVVSDSDFIDAVLDGGQADSDSDYVNAFDIDGGSA